MPITLPADDPKLLIAVGRHKRVHILWGLLLLVLGGMTQYTAGFDHPVSGLPFIAAGLACLYWNEPALLALVATTLAVSIIPTLNGVTTVLGPDPLIGYLELDALERWAFVVGKILAVLTAANQFFFYRLLYGTVRASADDPDLPIIPPLVPNRTNGLARTARALGFLSALAIALALGLLILSPGAYAGRILAEMSGSLGVLALGLGLGAAFSPTDEREAALWGIGLGLPAYLGAVLALLRLA